MRRSAVTFFAVAALACTPSEQTPAADSPAAAAAPALSAADLVGTWTQVARPMDSDSVVITNELVATADLTGWTVTFPGRPPQPITVTIDGDSVMTKVGPYESVLRKGMQVSTEAVSRLVDGKLVGITTARYQTAGKDSVVQFRTEGTRKP